MSPVRLPKPIRATCIVGGLWLLCGTLFLVQSFIPLSQMAQDSVVSVMFVIALFMALPGTILLVADWLRYACTAHTAMIASYGLFVATVYGIGWLINGMLAQPMAYLPSRMLLFVHALLLLGGLIYGLARGFGLAFAHLYRRLFAQEAGRLTVGSASLLGLWLTGQLLGQLAQHHPSLARLLHFAWLFEH